MVDQISLSIQKGEFITILGTSGSGKTTTLKMINRLIDPTSGQILMDGQPQTDLDLRAMRLKMGYVLQNIALFPNLTIQDNIAIQPEQLGWSRKQRLERARDLLAQVGLPPA